MSQDALTPELSVPATTRPCGDGQRLCLCFLRIERLGPLAAILGGAVTVLEIGIFAAKKHTGLSRIPDESLIDVGSKGVGR